MSVVQLPYALGKPRGPELVTTIPGPHSRDWVGRLAAVECPAITARRARRAEESGVDTDPIVWSHAEDCSVWDVDGNRFVDLTGAFAVAAAGHTHPRIVEAGRAQMGTLIHAMGDVFPSRPKIELGERLAALSPGDLGHAIFAQSGAEAVEAALKTAVMATGKTGVIAFSGAYHGLSYGALAATAYKASFRAPFVGQLNPRVSHLPFPGNGLPRDAAGATRCLELLEHHLRHPASGSVDIGAVIVEPIQGRGGIVRPPHGFLRDLADLARRHGVLLIADEIFTGLGRTGRRFACEHEGIVPDLLCLGKALAGGFPLSAVLGTERVMRSWGNSRGESLHTSTFLGNPLGCAMALAALDVIEDERLVVRSRELGTWLRSRLEALHRRFPTQTGRPRGLGLMQGIPIVDRQGHPDGPRALAIVSSLLRHGYILLPSGVAGDVIAFTPPLTIARRQLEGCLSALTELLGSSVASTTPMT